MRSNCVLKRYFASDVAITSHLNSNFITFTYLLGSPGHTGR